MPDQTQRVSVCYSYARVSTDRQAEDGISLDAQREETRKYFEYRLAPLGVVWGDAHADGGVSGYKKPLAERKAGKRLVERLESGDHVIMTALYRGFRSAIDAFETIEGWTRRGVHVHFIRHQIDSTTPTGKLMLRLMAILAEFERDMIAERTREAFRHGKVMDRILATKRRTGIWNQNAGLGFKLVGASGQRRKVPDHEERKLIRFIVELRDVHGLSFDEIYLHFWRNKIRTRNNKEWSEGRIRRAYYGSKGCG